jgi:hypothetical protein
MKVQVGTTLRTLNSLNCDVAMVVGRGDIANHRAVFHHGHHRISWELVDVEEAPPTSG